MKFWARSRTFPAGSFGVFSKLLSSAAATVTEFERYELGEGIEKKEENFAEEVMAQIKQSG